MSDDSHDIRLFATCTLANITQRDAAQEQSADAGAVPLAVALDSPSSHLKQMAVRALRNITVVEGGRRAACAPNVLLGLVKLLEDYSLPASTQYDGVGSLSMIGSDSGAAREEMKRAGAFESLRRFKHLNPPKNIYDVAVRLRDSLR